MKRLESDIANNIKQVFYDVLLALLFVIARSYNGTQKLDY